MVSFQCSKSWAASVEILSLQIRISIYFWIIKLIFMYVLLHVCNIYICGNQGNRSPASLSAGDRGKWMFYSKSFIVNDYYIFLKRKSDITFSEG